jgi:hypothetical protein
MLQKMRNFIKSPTTQQNDPRRILSALLIFIWICITLLVTTLNSFSPPGQRTPTIPNFTFLNAGPCLNAGGDLVEKFEVGEPQYICANMETDEFPVFLELYIFKSENKKQVYVDGTTFTSGANMLYHINPPLPVGKYWAYISWARPALIDFEFEVIEKR